MVPERSEPDVPSAVDAVQVMPTEKFLIVRR